MPLLSLLTHNRRALAYGVVLAFLLNVLSPNIAQPFGIAWNDCLSFSVLGGYLIYVTLGWLLKGWHPSALQRGVIYTLGAASVLLRYFATIIASDKAGQLIDATWGYLNVPCFLQSIAFFVFAKNIRWGRMLGSTKTAGILAKISSCSFGVYLIHMFVFWYGMKITGLNGASIVWRMAGPVVTCLICLSVTFIGKQILGIRRLFP